MIPDGAEMTRRFDVSLEFVPLALAGLFTAMVFFMHSVAQWFQKRNH